MFWLSFYRQLKGTGRRWEPSQMRVLRSDGAAPEVQALQAVLLHVLRQTLQCGMLQESRAVLTQTEDCGEDETSAEIAEQS